MKVSFRAYESHCVLLRKQASSLSRRVEPIVCFDFGDTSLPLILGSFVPQLKSQLCCTLRRCQLMTADYQVHESVTKTVEGASDIRLRKTQLFRSIVFYIQLRYGSGRYQTNKTFYYQVQYSANLPYSNINVLLFFPLPKTRLEEIAASDQIALFYSQFLLRHTFCHVLYLSANIDIIIVISTIMYLHRQLSIHYNNLVRLLFLGTRNINQFPYYIFFVISQS